MSFDLDEGGTWTYQVNDGLPVTITNEGTDLDVITDSIPVSPGDVLTIAWASNGVIVHGIVHYAGDENSGITFHECGHYGWDTSTSASGWNQRETFSFNWIYCYGLLNPAAIGIVLKINDAVNYTAAQFQVNLANLIAAIRAQYPGTPVILIDEMDPDFSYIDPWADYGVALYAVAAATTDCLVIPLDGVVPSYTEDISLYDPSDHHPNDAGHALIGSVAAGAFAPARRSPGWSLPLFLRVLLPRPRGGNHDRAGRPGRDPEAARLFQAGRRRRRRDPLGPRADHARPQPGQRVPVGARPAHRELARPRQNRGHEHGEAADHGRAAAAGGREGRRGRRVGRLRERERLTDHEHPELTGARSPAWNAMTVQDGKTGYMELLFPWQTPGQGQFRVDEDGNVTAAGVSGQTTLPAAAGDETSAINAALSSPGACVVALGPGVFQVSAPLVIPSGVTLKGAKGSVYDPAAYGTTIKPAPGWAQGAAPNNAVIVLGSGASTETGVVDLNIDGSALAVAAMGIACGGYTASNVRLSGVRIYKTTSHGVDASTRGAGDTWRCERVYVHSAGGDGFNGLVGDSDYIACATINAVNHGFYTFNAINTRLVACHAEWSGQNGFNISGDNTATGGLAMVGCSTDRNGQNGVYADAAGNWPLLITGLSAKRDGRLSVSAGWAALAVASTATVPVIVDGMTCFPGVDDGGGGLATPQYGINVNVGGLGAPAYVAVSGAFLHAATAGVNGAITNFRGVATRAGSWNAPAAIAQVADSA